MESGRSPKRGGKEKSRVEGKGLNGEKERLRPAFSRLNSLSEEKGSETARIAAFTPACNGKKKGGFDPPRIAMKRLVASCTKNQPRGKEKWDIKRRVGPYNRSQLLR